MQRSLEAKRLICELSMSYKRSAKAPRERPPEHVGTLTTSSVVNLECETTAARALREQKPLVALCIASNCV